MTGNFSNIFVAMGIAEFPIDVARLILQHFSRKVGYSTRCDQRAQINDKVDMQCVYKYQTAKYRYINNIGQHQIEIHVTVTL